MQNENLDRSLQVDGRPVQGDYNNHHTRLGQLLAIDGSMTILLVQLHYCCFITDADTSTTTTRAIPTHPRHRFRPRRLHALGRWVPVSERRRIAGLCGLLEIHTDLQDGGRAVGAIDAGETTRQTRLPSESSSEAESMDLFHDFSKEGSTRTYIRGRRPSLRRVLVGDGTGLGTIIGPTITQQRLWRQLL